MNLLELRKLKNVKQDDIARFLKITRQAYSRYERNEREPDLKTLKKLAEYFNVSVDYLISDAPENKLFDVDINDFSNSLKNIIEKISTLNDSECAEISKYIDFILSKRIE